MVQARFQNPNSLISGDWLEAHLSDPDLRIFDCTSHLRYGESDNHPYRYVSGLADYEAGHVPGAVHLDLQGEFSDQESPYLMTLPSAEASAKAFARNGVAEGTRVVLYARDSMQRATRFWWMLRWLGFDDAAVLDGGYDKWVADGRPVSKKPGKYPRGSFSLNLRPEVFVGKHEVLAAIGLADTCIPADYIVSQLTAFRDGTREHEMMTVVASTLSDDQIADLAAWYAGHEVVAILSADPADAPQTCTGCHGADGIALAEDVPNLAGEAIPYIDTQLKAFRLGNRTHEVMSPVAAELTDAEIRELAEWYAAIELEVELME